MTRTIEQMISAEILCCMSSLVATLAGGYGAAVTHVDAYGRRSTNGGDLANLTEQAFELAAPIDDWDEAAIEAGWSETEDGRDGGQHVFTDSTDGQTWCAANWQRLCEDHEIDPYQREVFEHWAVTDWFADKLEAAGEKVDKDFSGLCIWARTTTGQAIYADAVIERIYAETHTDV